MMYSEALVVGVLLTCVFLYVEAIAPPPISKKDCPAIKCPAPGPLLCPHGYDTDRNGCPTCNCIRHILCPDIACDIFSCPNGFEPSLNVCPSCECRQPKPLCPSVSCPSCPVGHLVEKDANGCVMRCTCDLTATTRSPPVPDPTPKCSLLKCFLCGSSETADPSCTGCECDIGNMPWASA